MAEAVAARSWTELGGVGAMAHGEFVEETPLSPGIMKYTQCDLERTRFYWLGLYYCSYTVANSISASADHAYICRVCHVSCGRRRYERQINCQTETGKGTMANIINRIALLYHIC